MDYKEKLNALAIFGTPAFRDNCMSDVRISGPYATP